MKREFMLNKNVYSDNIQDIILGINEVNRFDREKSKVVVNYKREPIELIIDSYGGSVYDGMALVSIIEMSETPVHGYSISKTISMGFIIYLACHKRFAHPLTTFMQHQLSASMNRDVLQGLEEDLEQKKKINNMMEDYIVSRTNIKKSKLTSLKEAKLDWYITGEEAVGLGIVDELVVIYNKR